MHVAELEAGQACHIPLLLTNGKVVHFNNNTFTVVVMRTLGFLDTSKGVVKEDYNTLAFL